MKGTKPTKLTAATSNVTMKAVIVLLLGMLFGGLANAQAQAQVVRLRPFYLAYATESDREPTEEEYDEILTRTTQFFNMFFEEFYATNTDVVFLGLESSIGVTLYGAEAGIPEPHFDIYIDFEFAVLFYTENSTPPTAAQTLATMSKAPFEDYILNYVRTFEGSPFATCNELIFSASNRLEQICEEFTFDRRTRKLQDGEQKWIRLLQNEGQNCIQNVLETARQNPDLEIIVSLIEAAGLEPIFECAGPFTALLPTNDGFGIINLQELRLPENIEDLRNLVLYHILPGATLITEFTSGPIDALFAGMQVWVGVDPIQFDGRNVLEADIVACNGYINILDFALDPFEQLTPCECVLDVGDNTCQIIEPSFIGGTLKCDVATCQFDTSECVACSGFFCPLVAFWLAIMNFFSKLFT